MYWAVRLSQAVCARVPGAEKLFLAEVPRWLDNAWAGDSVVGHSYTTSERIASCNEILFWIAASKSTELLAIAGPLKNRIWQDACRLQDRMEFALGVHNHLLNNARGLLIAALALPECKEAREWSDRAFRVWEELGSKLILEDGTFGEQSSHYHLLLCRTALEYWLAAARLGRELAPELRERIRAMFRLANDLLRADGSLPRFGDVCPDHGVEELRGLMAAGYFLGILDESPAERCITPLTFYYCDPVRPSAAIQTTSAGETLSRRRFCFFAIRIRAGRFGGSCGSPAGNRHAWRRGPRQFRVALAQSFPGSRAGQFSWPYQARPDPAEERAGSKRNLSQRPGARSDAGRSPVSAGMVFAQGRHARPYRQFGYPSPMRGISPSSPRYSSVPHLAAR